MKRRYYAALRAIILIAATLLLAAFLYNRFFDQHAIQQRRTQAALDDSMEQMAQGGNQCLQAIALKNHYVLIRDALLPCLKQSRTGLWVLDVEICIRPGHAFLNKMTYLHPSFDSTALQSCFKTALAAVPTADALARNFPYVGEMSEMDQFEFVSDRKDGAITVNGDPACAHLEKMDDENNATVSDREAIRDFGYVVGSSPAHDAVNRAFKACAAKAPELKTHELLGKYTLSQTCSDNKIIASTCDLKWISESGGKDYAACLCNAIDAVNNIGCQSTLTMSTEDPQTGENVVLDSKPHKSTIQEVDWIYRKPAPDDGMIYGPIEAIGQNWDEKTGILKPVN